jgi:hypothetical protein
MSAPPPAYAAASPAAAAALCRVAGIEPDSAALLETEQGPREFIEHLLEKEHFKAAVLLLAHGLPTREAIWWAWVCARRASGPEPAPEIRAALEGTERWITQPSEAHRRPMLEIADTAGLDSAAGAAALAVFFSGGSIAPPEIAPVEAPPHAAAKAIGGSITLSALGDDPETAPERFTAFVRQGLEVAKRIKLW